MGESGEFGSFENKCNYSVITNFQRFIMKKYLLVIIALVLFGGCSKTTEPVAPTLKWSKIGSFPVTALVSSGNTVYVGCNDYNNPDKAGLYISDYLGDTWVGHTIPNSSNGIISLSLYGKKLYAGTTSKFMNQTVGTLNGVFETSDDGLTWTARKTALYKSSDIQCIVNNGNDIFIGTDDKGVYYSYNSGENWIPMNYGLPTEKVNSLSIAGDKIWAGTDKGIILSNNYGKTWEFQVDEDYSIYTVASSGNLVCAGGTKNGTVFYSTDSGTSWKEIKIPDANGGIYTIVIDNNKIYVGADGGFFISSDNCKTWQMQNTGFDYGTRIQNISISNNHIYAGSFIYGLYRADLSDLK